MSVSSGGFLLNNYNPINTTIEEQTPKDSAIQRLNQFWVGKEYKILT